MSAEELVIGVMRKIEINSTWMLVSLFMVSPLAKVTF
jgi:hypothetical protein